MSTYSQLSRFFTIALSALFIFTGSLLAQNIGADMANAQKALNDKEFAKAQELLTGVVDEYAVGAMNKFGARFGTIYYFKGISELVLAQNAKSAKDEAGVKKWAGMAIESFKTCNETYADKADLKEKSKNPHEKLSLQSWGNAAVLLGDHSEAVRLFRQFIKEKEKKHTFQPTAGVFYATLANSYYSLSEPNIKEGNLYFTKAITDKQKLKTSDHSILKAYRSLLEASIKAEDEESFLKFLNDHRDGLNFASYQMDKYAPQFLNMAATSIKAGMFNTAYAFYGLIPNTTDVIEDMKAKLAQLPKRAGIVDGVNKIEVAKLKESLAKLEAKVSSGDPIEVSILMGLAYLGEQVSNKHGVYETFKLLEERYPKSKHREANLFNLVNVASRVASIEQTAEYGQQFLDAYPNSEKVSSVREKMLVSLFFGGNYRESLVIADQLLKPLAAKGASEGHDICLFVKGGSHFYLGQFDEAKPHLDEHVATYPESRLAMHASYFQAANLTRVGEWAKATKALNAFIEKYPNPDVNNYLPNAYYDSANAYYSDSQYSDALSRIEKLEKNFPGASIVGLALNLKGNIYESTEKHAEAEASYLKALKIAEGKGKDGVAAESLNYLVGLLSSETLGGKTNTRTADAVVHYDHFLKKYKTSNFKSQVLVFGLPSMLKAGRGKDALANLKESIVEIAATSHQFYLEESIDSYAEAFLEMKGNTPVMLKDTFYGLKGIDLSNKKANALLRIAVIGAYEKALKSPEVAKNKKLELRYSADIKALFNDLKKEFKPKDLTNFILIRIGDYLRTKTSAPKQSVPYYQELLTRGDSSAEKSQALLGIADVLGSSASPADKKKAIATLEDVLKSEDTDDSSRGEALFRLTELYAEQSDWVNTEKTARMYLKEKNTKKAADVSYLFALSFDKRKMNEDALFNYGQVALRNQGYLKVSAPSMKRLLEIMWARNYPAGKVITIGEKQVTLEKSDRQTAYEEIGSRFIKRTEKIRKTNNEITDEEKKAWDEVAALVKKFEASGDVKTLAEIKAEAARRTR